MLDIGSNIKKDDDLEVATESPDSLISKTELAGLNKMDDEKIVVVFTYIILALFIAMSSFVFVLASNKTNVLENKQANYDNLENQLKSSKELVEINKLAEQFDSGLKKVSSYLSSRSTWSLLFKELQNTTPTEITYKSFNVNEKTLKTTVSGEANNFSGVALLLASLEDSDIFSDVVLVSTSQTQGENQKITFNL